MAINKDFLVGDKIDVTADGERFYKSIVGEVYKNGLILINAPIYRQSVMQLGINDEVGVVYYRESGRYITLMRVVDVIMQENLMYYALERLTDPEKNQRREFYRLPTHSVDTKLCMYEDGLELLLARDGDTYEARVLAEARAKDISTAGVGLVTTKWACSPGENYMLKLYFDGFRGETPPIQVCARVMRSEVAPDSGIYNVGMQFFGLPKEKSDYLTKYILNQQQKMILRRRLIEGD